jgi:hypothetical protein
MLRIRIRDPVPLYTLDPGSRMGKNQDPDPGSESGMNNPGLIYFNSLMRIRDRKKFGSGMEKIRIRDKHPGSSTLLLGMNINTFWYLRGSSETRGQLFDSREQNSPQAVTRYRT